MDNEEWFKQHLDEIIGQYPGKLVSVHDGKVVAVGDDLNQIREIIVRKKRNGEIKGVPFTGRADKDGPAFRITNVMV